jgi:hypothetical protein
MEFTPTLLWSQTYQTIEIQIDLPNISSEILTCENNVFHFECLSSNKKYLINFELEGEVSGNNILSRSDKRIVIHLDKKEEGDKWDFLAKKRGIYKNNIKINWDKWEDSDCDDENDVKNIDMGGLGRMGGLGGMGGMDMSMLQEMMGNMGDGEDDGEDNGEDDGGEDGGEDGSEDGGEDGSEDGGEDGGEDGDKN